MYEKMLAESKRTGLPKLCRADLEEVDRNIVQEGQLTSFVWMLRENGTHIITLTEREPLGHLEAVNGSCDAERHFYIADAGELTECSYEEAQAFIKARHTPPEPIKRVVTRHFDEPLTDEETAVIDRLVAWCRDDFDQLNIYRDRDGFLANYSNSDNSRCYTIGAVYDEKNGFTLHS